METIFISSPQKEFAAERQALKAYLQGDPLFRRFFNVVLFDASVQVMLFSDRLEVMNPGELPPTLTPEKLRRPHASIPHNPLLADPLFLAHYIEKAGSGTLDMIALCREVGLPEPDFRQDGGQWVVTLHRPVPQAGTETTTQVTAQVETQSNRLENKRLQEVAAMLGVTTAQVTAQVAAQVITVLEMASTGPKSRQDLQFSVGMKHREHFRKAYLEPLVEHGWLDRTIPDKPTSRLQQYRLSAKGAAWFQDRKQINPSSRESK